MKTIIRSPEINAKGKLIDVTAADTVDQQSVKEKTSAEVVNKPLDAYQTSADERDNELDSMAREIRELKALNNELTEQLNREQEKNDETAKNLEILSEEASKKGYQEGLESGRSESKAAIDNTVSEWQALIDKLTQQLVDDIADSEEYCVEIAFAAVCKLIGESAGSKQQVIDVVKATTAQLSSPDKFSVYVSKHDYPLLEQQQQTGTTVIACDEVAAGGCIIKSANGSLDARLDQQLKKLKDMLLQIHSSRRPR